MRKLPSPIIWGEGGQPWGRMRGTINSQFFRLLTLAITLTVACSAHAQPAAFEQRCAVCHQRNGAGIPGIYPPIAGTIGIYVRVPAGRSFLVHLMLNGMSGAISSRGTTYAGLMPPAGEFTDEQLAQTLDYVLRRLNANDIPRDFKPITAAEFKAARAKPMSPSEVLNERNKLVAALGNTAHK